MCVYIFGYLMANPVYIYKYKHDNINSTVTKFLNKNKIFGPSKFPVYFRLPWIGR